MKAFLKLCRLVDLVPELPYFILALGYVWTKPRELALHVFSASFMFLFFSLAIGTTLKLVFHRSRPMPRYTNILLKYDFPSLHSLVSIGAIVFVYFIEPLYSIALVPMGAIYVYSRVRIGAHHWSAVLGGAALGLVIGLTAGEYFVGVDLSERTRLLFTGMFFVIPAVATIYRLRAYHKRNHVAAATKVTSD